MASFKTVLPSLALLSLLLFTGCIWAPQTPHKDSLNTSTSNDNVSSTGMATGSTELSPEISTSTTTSSTVKTEDTNDSSTTMSTAKKKKTTTTTTSTAPSLDESLPVLASEKTPYTYVNYAGLIDDKPVYVVGQGRDKMFIYFDGKELGKSYGSAGSPRSVGGRLAYVAQNKSKYFLVLDGAEGNKYDYVEPPVDVGGTPAYIATKGTRKYAVYDGKEYGDGYDNVESFVAGIVGNLCFAGLKDRKDHLVCGGKEVGGGFNSIASPYAAEYDGKLLYVGQNDSTKYVIYDGNLVGNG